MSFLKNKYRKYKKSTSEIKKDITVTLYFLK